MTTSVVESVVAAGAAAGNRAIEVRVEYGCDLRILPDRGFDIADAWIGGRRVSWHSVVGESRWLGDFARSFGGGLVTTCGLDNVGAPSEGYGLHGTYSSLPARDIRLDQTNHSVVATAVIVDADSLEERHLRVMRRISTGPGPQVFLLDHTANEGTRAVEAPVLYHVNLVWDSVDIDSREVVPRDDVAAAAANWRDRPDLDRAASERVYEHVGATRAVVALDDLRLTLRWNNLPRLWQWVHPALGVLGLEPANCSVLGRAHDRSQGRLPMLEPGEVRETYIEISAEVA